MPTLTPLRCVFPIVLAGGCVGRLQPATATFAGIDRPIMLSKVDRIGGGPPAPHQQVSTFDGEAVSLYARSESRTETVTTVEEVTRIDNASLYNAARQALLAGPGVSILITKLRPWARGYISFVKNTILVEGAVVSGGGQ